MISFLEKHRITSLILTILITIEIFYFSSLTFGPATVGTNWIARIYHVTVFFLFTIFLFATIKGNKEIKAHHILIILFISLTHGILDEVHQIFVPFRDPSIRDILTNSIGVFSAILIYTWINKFSKKEKEISAY